MAVIYGSNALPNDVITVREQSSTAVSLAFDASIGIVAGYNASAGSLDQSKVGTNIEVGGLDEDPADVFGPDSELYRQIQLARANGAGRISVTPVPETDVTDSVASSTSISLSETVIDPRSNPEHSITAQDTVASSSVTVNLVNGTPSTPSTAGTLNLNPQTGEGEFDSSSDYDVSYTAGAYDVAITEAAKADVRFVTVPHSDPAVATTLSAKINARAQEFDFKRGVMSVPTNVDPADYVVPFDDQRMVLVAPAYGVEDGIPTWLGPVVGASMAGQPLGTSATGNVVNGITSLAQQFSVSETTDFGETEDLSQVTVVREDVGGREIVEDLTTSTGSKFDDVYRCEIIDDITYSLHLVNKDFIGGSTPNTPDGRELGLEAPARSVLRSAAENSPPLLASADGEGRPFVVQTGAGANDETATMTVGIDVVGIPKTVLLNLSVGPVQTFEGAE
jgi:hypothetical protein